MLGLGLGLSGQGLPVGIPTRLPALWGWFDADNVTLDGNGRVQTMKKIAGSGVDLTQSTSSDRPNYNAGGGDGRPEIVFDPVASAADRVIYSELAGAEGQTHTLVAKNINGNQGELFFWQSKRAALLTRNGRLEYAENESGNNENLIKQNIGDWFIISHVINSASSVDVYVNGTHVLNFDPGTFSSDIQGNRPRIGFPNDGSLNGDHDVRVYVANETALSASEIQNLHNYLRSRYLDTPFVVLANGQSLQEKEFSVSGDATFRNTAGAYYNFVKHVNVAVSGSHLAKSSRDDSADDYWWDDTTSSKGPQYTRFFDFLGDRNQTRFIKYQLGTSDRSFVGDGQQMTKAEYKTAMKEFFAQLKSDFPNATIVITVYHRHENQVATAQNIREVELEVADEVSYVELGPEVYDIDLTDNVHLTSAGFDEQARREAERIAALDGERSLTGTFGPQISSATVSGSDIDLTIEHDAGDDISVPSGAEAMFHAEEDGSVLTINSASRVDATTVRLNLGSSPTGEVKVWASWQTNTDLSATNAEVVVDNATNPLPLRSVVGLQAS